MLSIRADVKTKKGEEYGFCTGILYLAPHDIAGYRTVCPKASEGCKAACLYSAGHGTYSNVQQARIRKTRMFFEERERFFEELVKGIKKLERLARMQGLQPIVRLNGTSDISFEKYPVVVDSVEYTNIFEAFPHLSFYDYTKVPNRKVQGIRNYYLTFSLSEDNDEDAVKWLKGGGNVAVVLKVRKGESLPEQFGGYPVIDGDLHDVRTLDDEGVIVGLRIKGKARYDETGFVRDPEEGFKI